MNLINIRLIILYLFSSNLLERKTASFPSIKVTDPSLLLILFSKRPLPNRAEMFLPKIILTVKHLICHQPITTKNGFQHVTPLLIQLQEDTELKLSHRLILTTTPTTYQVRPPSEQATLILREDQARFIETETQSLNSQVKKPFRFIATSRIKPTSMDQDNL